MKGIMQTEMTMSKELATDIQRDAIEEALGYIKRDGDRAGAVRMITDFTMRVNQYSNEINNKDELVRTWIAFPNGRLTWKS